MIPPPGNYAAGASKVIQAYFHAAAFTGRTIEHVLEWIAPPTGTTEPGEILREHPHAARFWAGLLHGALNGDHRTVGNTIPPANRLSPCSSSPTSGGDVFPRPSIRLQTSRV